MSGKIAKSRIPVMPQSQLPSHTKEAIIALKNQLKRGQLPQVFGNRNRPFEGEGSPLPRLDDGCQYFEFQAGHAHQDDPQPRGSHRLVAEINVKPRRLREIYYTESHYQKGTFYRVV